ncbi:DUF2069 domain-containing protein [Ottowia testudinis]|uniref:DUF2069 domain-containing protein n=1 Tax=Ottowia testudinis TaxID=2816950 RepID=A0A975CKD4_9BURK|nr:DUF2069 domain-containing protein [Ottowia testudinis]QTD46597.1 DUF2069 domain-containing protein [Ottowia testudinis]
MPTAANTLPNTPSSAALATRAFAVAILLALCALCLAWELWLAPVRPGGSWLALKALPLLLPLPGLWRLRMFTYRWTSLFIWLYFVEGVVRATSDRAPSSWYALGEVVLTVLLFAACGAHIRWRQRQARA